MIPKYGAIGAVYSTIVAEFTGRNVKISEIAKATGKDPNYIRFGLQQGILKFGTAFKFEGSTEFNYYCPDKKVWEETGYFRKVSSD